MKTYKELTLEEKTKLYIMHEEWFATLDEWEQIGWMAEGGFGSFEEFDKVGNRENLQYDEKTLEIIE